MLSHEINRTITQVGRGTPGGELMRRYWLPIAAEASLTMATPKLRVRALGEDLVLFRDGKGRLGLVEEQCCHRSASLLYGFVEDEGLRCPYHGWLFDTQGKCIEQPFEPKESLANERACQKAYAVQTLGGVVWAYMGPQPAPLLPRWSPLVRLDGQREVHILPELECNWLQVMENSCDPTHLAFLHVRTMIEKGKGSEGTYYNRPIEGLNFELVEEPNWVGVRKQRVFGGDNPEEEIGHPVIFPYILMSPQREHIIMHMRLPVDDTHTQIIRYQFTPNDHGEAEAQPDVVPMVKVGPFKNEEGIYHMNTFACQDAMAWETQGPVTDRERENLRTADAGIALFRRLLRDQIKRVQDGQDPKGLVRDPALNEMIHIDLSTGQRRVAKEMAKA